MEVTEQPEMSECVLFSIRGISSHVSLYQGLVYHPVALQSFAPDSKITLFPLAALAICS
jgi:hypothetical protein